MTRSDHLAEEVVQETFIRAWKYLDSFRGEGSMEGWLIRICRNCVFDLSAQQRRTPTNLPTIGFSLPDEQAEMWAMLDDLPPVDREVLVVCGALGYDYESAAQILDVPVGTIRSRLSRARDRLSSALAAAEAG